MDDEKRARDTISIYSQYIARYTVENKISFSALFAEANLKEFHQAVLKKGILQVEKTVDYRKVAVPVLHGFSSLDDSIDDYSELYCNTYLKNKRWTIDLPYSEMCFIIVRLMHVCYEMDHLNSAWREYSELGRAKALFINNWNSCKQHHPTEDECGELLRSLNAAQVRAGLIKGLGKAAAVLVALYFAVQMGTSLFGYLRDRAAQRREAASSQSSTVYELDGEFYEPEYYDEEPQQYSYTGGNGAYEDLSHELSNLPADAIEWSEAAYHVGESVAIYGRIVDTEFASDSAGQPTFLDIGRGYPDPNRLSVVIWGEDRGNFDTSPERAYRGNEVCVYGEVYPYEDHYCIQVTSPSQIIVLN